MDDSDFPSPHKTVRWLIQPKVCFLHAHFFLAPHKEIIIRLKHVDK